MKLDKNKIYDLSELTSEELNNIWEYLTKNDEHWYTCPLEEVLNQSKTDRLLFDKYNWQWCNISKPTANAKELFYTLENIQVDCSELTKEQIEDMCNVYESNGYKQWIDPEAFIIIDNFTYLRIDSENEFYITGGLDTKTTITYKKFMELFGNKEKSQEFKNLVEVLNEELTEEYNNSQFKQIANSLADLLEYKNKMYGNSALEPLNIFNNKCKVGQRLDDKLARIKNSNELRKNDICDLIGYLILTCKENNWTNFDEFKD